MQNKNEQMFYQEIAASIRATREKLGLSQQFIADKLGVSLVEYQQYESAQNPISIYQMYLFINATQPDLIKGENWPKI